MTITSVNSQRKMLNKQTNLPIAVAGWIGVGGKWRGKIAGFSCLDCKLCVILVVPVLETWILGYYDINMLMQSE